MKRLAGCLLLLIAVLPAHAAGASWWNNDWKFRKEITFDVSPAAANVTGTAQDVPVLIRLSLANFSYFADTKSDGSDFRVIGGDDKTPLNFHFEKYDPQNQMALLWVRVPQITGGSKNEKIYLYYGNPDAKAAADAPGTYDASMALVLSFLDGVAPPADLTAYKNISSASTAALTPASLIAGGAKFSGGESITVPSTPSLRLLPNQGLTASAWVRIEKAQQAAVVALTDGGKELSLRIEGNRFSARAAVGTGAPIVVTQASDFSLSQWHHVALTAGSGKLTLFVDGAPAGSAALTVPEIGGNFTVGAQGNGQFLTGDVDEVEVSKIARSPDWLRAAALSQGMDANLVVYGGDGQREGGSQTSYFVTIAKNLTIDGWVVIAICMAMLVIALLIMIVKAIFLARVERANSAFMRAFRHLSGDATALATPVNADEDLLIDKPTLSSLANDKGAYGASTLFRLYQHGVSEVNKRIAGATLSASVVRTLSPQSTEAIRAAMDASLTRLQQGLSSQMVLLTIAISGGPFLGLLGTVIGVMITFAAIALSGDVNVNAIAPGTAAALAATVAGLSVAIPSLFGYNWLNSRIKSITADNRVFVDEFVTRVAEQYS
jgi:biopolymer transport protein ExbB